MSDAAELHPMHLKNEPDPFSLIENHGDLLERHYSSLIQERIPSYARMWADYIGNDGASRALPVPNANESFLRTRDKYWERLYTLFESLALSWRIEEEVQQIEDARRPQEYMRNLNLWLGFYAHQGRIHDMVKTVAGDLSRPELLRPLEEYWKQRNIVLHGPKVPLKWVNASNRFPGAW